MNFINPIEILELQNENPHSLSFEKIKRAKKRLYADIELSDNGNLNYKGIILTKTDCEKAIENLENPQLIDFYYHLCISKLLNDYLVNQDENIFYHFKYESIYKDEKFINFVSPFFSYNFGKSILKAYKNEDSDLMSRVLLTRLLINKEDTHKGLKILANEISQRIEQVQDIIENINDNDNIYKDKYFEELFFRIRKLFPSDLLNQLPPYYLSQINLIALTINNLQISIWNNYGLTEVPMKLLKLVLELNIESVNKPVFLKNYEIIRNKHAQEKEYEKNEPILKKWASLLVSLKEQNEQIEERQLNSKEAFSNISVLISINELNNLSSFANEIRNQIAISLRNMAIKSCNKQNDIKTAINFINYALKITVSKEVNQLLQKDKNDIMELERKYIGIITCYFCGNNPTDNESGLITKFYKEISRGGFIQRTVQYSQSEITFPRCNNCKKTHEIAKNITYFFIISFAIFGFIVGSTMNSKEGFFYAFLGAVIGTGLGYIIKFIYLAAKSVKDCSKSRLLDHPLTPEILKQGWSFEQPNP